MAWELSGIPDRTAADPARTRAATAASTYHRYFDDVHDLASRLTDSPAEAAAVTRAAAARLVEGRLVRARGDAAGRFVATAYHEAATTADRATQPVAAGTHTLPPGLVDAVNAHVARCRSCRRWGSLPYSDAPAPPQPDPALRVQIWNDVAPPPDPQLPRLDLTPRFDPPAAPPLDAYRTRTAPGRHRRWLAIAAVAVIALAAIAAAALVTSDGGRKGRSDLSVFASGQDHATATATSGDGTAVPAATNSAHDGSSPADASTSSTPSANNSGGSTTRAPSTINGDEPAAGGGAGGGITANPTSADQRDGGGSQDDGAGSSGNSSGSPNDGSGNDGGAEIPPTPAAQQPTPVTQPPATSTPPPAPTPTPPPPTPPPTEPPAPEPTTIIDQLPVVPTVIEAVPTLLPLLGDG